MATHFSVLAWRIPGTGEPGGLRSDLDASLLTGVSCSLGRQFCPGEGPRRLGDHQHTCPKFLLLGMKNEKPLFLAKALSRQPSEWLWGRAQFKGG